MERYEDTIMRELNGKTPKEKYEFLLKLKKDKNVFENYIKNLIGIPACKEILQAE